MTRAYGSPRLCLSPRRPTAPLTTPTRTVAGPPTVRMGETECLARRGILRPSFLRQRRTSPSMRSTSVICRWSTSWASRVQPAILVRTVATEATEARVRMAATHGPSDAPASLAAADQAATVVTAATAAPVARVAMVATSISLPLSKIGTHCRIWRRSPARPGRSTTPAVRVEIQACREPADQAGRVAYPAHPAGQASATSSRLPPAAPKAPMAMPERMAPRAAAGQ